MENSAVIIAILGFIASIITAAVTAWSTTQKALVQIEVKVDLLWKTYIVDAIKESRTSGLIASNSPENPTTKWEDSVPLSLRTRIEETIRTIAAYLKSPYDITVETVNQIGIEEIAREIDLNPRQVIGTIFIQTERILDELSTIPHGNNRGDRSNPDPDMDNCPR